MRTTLDLPDPLFRKVKVRAAEEGKTLKELLTSFVEKCIQEPPAATPPVRSPLPTPLRAKGAPIPSLTNAEIDDLFMQEDLERWGITRESSSQGGDI